MARNDHKIAALKRERAGYVAVGDDDRVRQVDEQLKHYGYEGRQDPPTDPDGGPAGRTPKPPGRRTTAAGKGKTAARKAPARKPADDPAGSPADHGGPAGKGDGGE